MDQPHNWRHNASEFLFFPVLIMSLNLFWVLFDPNTAFLCVRKYWEVKDTLIRKVGLMKKPESTTFCAHRNEKRYLVEKRFVSATHMPLVSCMESRGMSFFWILGTAKNVLLHLELLFPGCLPVLPKAGMDCLQGSLRTWGFLRPYRFRHPISSESWTHLRVLVFAKGLFVWGL